MFGRLKKCVSAILAVCIAAMSFGTANAAETGITSGDASENIPNFSYIGNVGTLKPEQTAEFARQFYAGLLNHDSKIKLYVEGVNISSSDVQKSITSICTHVAECYDVGILTNFLSYNLEISTENGKKYFVYVPTYFIDDSSYQTTFNSMMQQLDDIIGLMDENWCDYEKALFLHEYIAVNGDYDDTLKKYKAYDMLTDHESVCEGYSSLYSMLLNRVGIKCNKVSSNRLNHVWNLVQIEGKWYHVDVTWDDRYHGGHPGLVSHDNFLKTSDEIYASGHDEADYVFRYDGDVYATAETNPVTGFWNDVNTSFGTLIYDEGDSQADAKWAVMKYNRNGEESIDIYDMDNITSYINSSASPTEEMTLVNFDAIWTVPGMSNSYYPGVYSGILVKDNVMFFHTGTDIYAYFNGKLKKIFQSTSSDKRIYGLCEKNGKLCYYLSPAPTATYENSTAGVSTEYELGDFGTIFADVMAELGEVTVSVIDPSDNSVILTEGNYDYRHYTVPTDFSKADSFLEGIYKDSSFNELADGMFITQSTNVYAKWGICKFVGGVLSGMSGDNVLVDLYMDIDDELIGKATASDYVKITVNGVETTVALPTLGSKSSEYNAYKVYTVQLPFAAPTADISVQPYYGGAAGTAYSYNVELSGETTKEKFVATSVTAASSGLAADKLTLSYGDWSDCSFEGGQGMLTDTIELNLFMKINSDLVNDGNVSVTIYQGDDDTTGTTADITSENYDSATGCYNVGNVSLPPKDSNKKLYVQANYKGLPGYRYEYSINDYFTKLQETQSSAANIAEAAQDYCAVAEAYFNNDTQAADALVSDVNTNYNTVVTSAENIANEFASTRTADTSENIPEGLTYEGTSLILEDTTSIRCYFTLGNPDDYIFEVNGVEVTPMQRELNDGGVVYYPEMTDVTTNISTKNLAKSIIVTVVDKDDSTKKFEIVTSPCGYAYKVINNSTTGSKHPDLDVLMKAMIVYYKQAVAYAGS